MKKKIDVKDLLVLHGRSCELDALAEDRKRLKHSEREAIIALQETCMKGVAEIERLRLELKGAELGLKMRPCPDAAMKDEIELLRARIGKAEHLAKCAMLMRSSQNIDIELLRILRGNENEQGK